MIMKKFQLLSAFIIILLFPCIYVSAKEATKTIEAELQQDYIQCTFYLSFEKEIVTDCKIVTPTGEEFELLASEDFNGLKRTLKNVKAGTYKVVITKQITDEDADITEQDLIGKVTLQVKAEEESTTAITSDLKLAKEIAGLHYYWKDDNIVVEWTDETCGNIDIVVVNSKTLQIIDKKTVSDQLYSCNIDQNIEEILLRIIPTVSNGVKGAGEEYAIKVDNHPNAVIEFFPVEYTNQDFISAKVTLNQSYELLYTNNGENVGRKEFSEPGNYEIEVPTFTGNNNVKVYVIDEKGNMRSTSIQFVKDIEPPVLKIKNDITGLKTYESTISLSGTVEDYDNLIFRNNEVSTDWEGKFEITADLKDGENEIILTATDLAGNIAEYRATVTKLVIEEKPFPWKFVFSFLLLVVFLCLLLFKIYRKKRKNTQQNITTTSKDSFKLYKRKNDTFDYICFMLSLGIYISLMLFVFHIGTVKSISMEPTVKTNEIILSNRLAYKIIPPKRGDIITYKDPVTSMVLLKRIIGLPGDEISFVDGYVFINGIICDESEYLKEEIETNSNKSFSVPNNSYFVMGDNRENSIDSRYFENPYIEDKMIIGKMIFHLHI